AFPPLTRSLKPGDRVEVTVERDGKPHTVVIETVRPPAGATDPHFGLVVNPLDIKEGVRLLDVVPNGTAARAGLRKGDRLVAVAGEAIQDRQGYFAILRALRPGEEVTVIVERDGEQRSFQIRTAADTKKKKKGAGTLP